MRIPRKKKKQIPKGLYCYNIVSGWKYFKDGNYGFEIKNCLFYSKSYCNLVKYEVIDQCKMCNLKLNYGK